jgi:selenocysteine lyase/cysteine desulfurase
MSIVEEVGVAAIERHVSELNTRLIDGLGELGATVVTPRDPARRGPLVCVRSVDAERLVELLGAERVVVSSRDQNVRLAAHLYTTDGDIDRTLAVLAGHRELLA